MLKQHARAFIAADPAAELVEEHLTHTKIGDGKLKKTAVRSIMHYINQMDLYETLAQCSYSNLEKLCFLF